MAKFLLQQNGHTRMGALTATIYDLIAGENSFRGTGIHQVLWTDLDSICKVKDIEQYTPVGSIEFVEKALQKTVRAKRIAEFGRPFQPDDVYRLANYHIKPINVPTQLQKPEYLRRKVLSEVAPEALAGCFKLFEQESLFIKSATQCKKSAGVYELDWLPIKEGDRFFVSEVIPDIVSEWRCFVLQGEVIDMRRYMGNPWAQPPKELFVKQAVNAWRDAPLAYTLDIGMTGSGTPFVIECHNFVSCGLYGCEDPVILTMLRRGYQHELKQICDEFGVCI